LQWKRWGAVFTRNRHKKGKKSETKAANKQVVVNFTIASQKCEQASVGIMFSELPKESACTCQLKRIREPKIMD
jgi:hypothetical protein